jgi:hypothetical protein
MPFRVPQLACFFITGTLLVAAQSNATQNATNIHFGDLVGMWTLESIYRTSNVQGPSNSEAKRLLGTHIVYGPHNMSSCGLDIAIDSVEQHKLSEEDLLQDARVHFSELGLRGNMVEMVIIDQGKSGECFGAFPPPGRLLFIKSKNELIVDFEGIFYRAVRTH